MDSPRSGRWPPGVTARSPRSCPAQKPRPEPVMTSTRVSGESIWSMACATSLCMSTVKLLSLSGRFRVMRATPSPCSNRMFWKEIIRVLVCRESRRGLIRRPNAVFCKSAATQEKGAALRAAPDVAGASASVGVLPATVLDLDHHSGALVQAEVIGGAHVEDAVRAGQVGGLLQRIAQRGAEGLGAGLAGLERDRHRVLQQERGVPRMAAEGGHAALAVGLFVGRHIGGGGLLHRVVRRELVGHEHGPRGQEGALAV